jgi:phospholipid-binding lipoprotein MlaA
MTLTAIALLLSAAEPAVAALPSQAQTPTGPVLPAAPQNSGAAGSQSTATDVTNGLPAPVPSLSPEGNTPDPAVAAQSDIVVTARPRGDPLRRANVVSFQATQAVDDAVIGPAAHTYEHVVPSPVRGGLRNFFYNLHEPTVFLNYLVQLKPGKAAETLGRFAVNTTIGVVGVMDVAKRRPFNLPRRPNSFSDTLGYYGVKARPRFAICSAAGSTDWLCRPSPAARSAVPPMSRRREA